MKFRGRKTLIYMDTVKQDFEREESRYEPRSKQRCLEEVDIECQPLLICGKRHSKGDV